ncbi:MAG: hypothetical protein V4621_08125 [Pseudomonadota bacterium]
MKRIVLDDLAAMVVTGVVTSVDKDDRTIDVDPDDEGAELVGVRLRSVVDDVQDGFTIWPVVGSTVTVLMLDDHTGLVVQYSAVEGYTLNAGEESFKQLMADFFSVIGRLVFMTNNGATLGLTPDSITAVNDLARRSNLLFPR